jgi:predicted lipid-binding transport protein (Tim44 family)
MKRLFIALLTAAFGMGLVIAEADAKRLGGGRTSGMARDSVIKREATPPVPAAPVQSAASAPTAPAAAAKPAAMPPATQPSGMSRWLGPIAGIAAGIGLAALLSHLGLGDEFASLLLMVLIVAAVFFLVRMFLRKRQAPGAALRYAGTGVGGVAADLRREPVAPPVGFGSAAQTAKVQRNVLAGFDGEAFLRQAKLNFIRLQAANDAGNLEDIRAFTTPEMFAEIKLQMQERGTPTQQTDVVTLEAEMLDVSQENDRYVASVRFHGSLREQADAAPTPFDEAWHLVKPVDGSSGWVIAGIQQMQ